MKYGSRVLGPAAASLLAGKNAGGVGEPLPPERPRRGAGGVSSTDKGFTCPSHSSTTEPPEEERREVKEGDLHSPELSYRFWGIPGWKHTCWAGGCSEGCDGRRTRAAQGAASLALSGHVLAPMGRAQSAAPVTYRSLLSTALPAATAPSAHLQFALRSRFCLPGPHVCISCFSLDKPHSPFMVLQASHVGLQAPRGQALCKQSFLAQQPGAQGQPGHPGP